jgi:hypothetical protein
VATPSAPGLFGGNIDIEASSALYYRGSQDSQLWASQAEQNALTKPLHVRIEQLEAELKAAQDANDTLRANVMAHKTWENEAVAQMHRALRELTAERRAHEQDNAQRVEMLRLIKAGHAADLDAAFKAGCISANYQCDADVLLAVWRSNRETSQ